MENISQYDYICVGAGITGTTFSRIKAEQGKKILLIDKRDHIGGNAYSERDHETNIEVHKYGAHLFHTNNKKVWNFINQFSEWTNYQHKVWTTHNNEVFPMPINLGTINQFFHKAYTPKEAQELIKQQAGEYQNIQPKNLTEQGIKLIGEPLFNAFIKNYTAKQWQTPAEQLAPEIITRLPVRYNYNNRYFTNIYEGLPKKGYYNFFKNLIDHHNITLKLNTNWNDIKQNVSRETKVIYSGPIDEFYNYEYGELNWRSLDLIKETLNKQDFQGCPVMNYADLEQPYTRIHEFKHFHPERWGQPGEEGYTANKTTIVREYSKTWSRGEEPYYPVRTDEDLKKLQQYEKLAQQEDNIIFAGRLGKYKYYDMDQVFTEAIELAENTR
jgi:UDP-galactopyranose mutase